MLAVHLIAIVGATLTAGLIIAVAAALLRRWPLATRISRAVVLAAATTFGALLLFTGVLLVDPRVLRGLLPHASDPSQAARALAELISSLMNCGALSVLAGVVAAPIWVLARRRLRSTDAGLLNSDEESR